MENLSLKEFAAALSGKEPVPGGGGELVLLGMEMFQIMD